MLSLSFYHRSFSQSAIEQLLPDHGSPPEQDTPPSLGIDSLTFHDHHLGRTGDKQSRMTSPSLQEEGVRRGNSSSCNLSPLLRHKRIVSGETIIQHESSLSDELSDRIEKQKTGSVPLGWLSKLDIQLSERQ